MVVHLTKAFGRTREGLTVSLYELSNGNGMRVRVIDYGAAIQSVVVPDREGNPVDVALGYDDLASYENGSCFYGAIVGRYANRIGDDGRFFLDGREIRLEKNSEERNHVHGVFAKRMFEASIDGGELVMRYLSPDGEEGFPGDLSLEVRCRLREDNALELNYSAATDAPTVVNLTNHCYFNLNGPDGSTVLNHLVRLNISYFTEYTPSFAQTGRIIPVDGTPLDFREEHSFGERFLDDYPQFRICTGYDHNMILDGEPGALKRIGTARSEKTGICLEAFTTEPAIQFYSGNFMHLDPVPHGKFGICYPKNGGFCFEAQHYPDSVHHPQFPSTVLQPGETYTQKTIYRFP